MIWCFLVNIYKGFKYYLVSKFIVKVAFIDKKNLIFFNDLIDICKVNIVNSENKEIYFSFKKDRRNPTPFLKNYIVEAYFDETLSPELKDLGDHVLLSLVCVRMTISYKTLCLYLIDRYLDEALKFQNDKT